VRNKDMMRDSSRCRRVMQMRGYFWKYPKKCLISWINRWWYPPSRGRVRKLKFNRSTYRP